MGLLKTFNSKIDKTQDFLKQFIDSCSDENNKSAVTELKKMIQKFGGIPSKESESESWEDLAAELLILGVESMFKINVQLSTTEAGKYILTLSPFRMFLKKSERYENMSHSKAYKQYIRDLTNLLDLKLSEKDVINIFEFERRLANITKNGTTGGQLTTLEEFQNNQTRINWNLILEKLSLEKLSDEFQINITNPQYFEMLNCNINNVNISVVRNYIIWQLITTHIRALPSSYQKKLNEMIKKIGPKTPIQSRDEFCYEQVTTHLPMVFASHFVPGYISNESRSNISEIYDNLKTVLKSRIEKSDWMDEETINKAVKKLKSMKLRIGFPESLRDKQKMLKPYENVKLRENAFLENLVQIRKVNFEQEISKLTSKSEDFIDWPAVVHSINSYYHLHTNEVVLAVSLLRDPLFDPSLPKFFQYGSLGVYIAHEITHGFDTQGSSFDEKGNLKNWWDPATYDKFIEKSECFIDQANSTVEPRTNTNFNGLRTLGENIADSGGLQIAYEAFMAKMREKGEKKVELVGYEDFSDEKMFFMSYAHGFCDHMETRIVKHRMGHDVHLFGEARVNNALKNFPKFAEVFGCESHHKMVLPEDEICKIW